MRLNRFAAGLACVLLVFMWSAAASAQKTYLLGGNSGAQIQVGGGLPLPIQLTDTNGDLIPDWGAGAPVPLPPGTAPPLATTGVGAGVFPPLLIPAAPGATLMDTAPGGALVIPAGVLSRPAFQNTLGQSNNNPALHAVATNLGYKWPANAATLKARQQTTTALGAVVALPLNPTTVYKAGTPVGGGQIRYRNPGKTAFFGGPANLNITPMLGTPPPALPVNCPGPAVCGPLKSSVAVTIFAIGQFSPPPCAGANCNAIILAAAPNGVQAAGGKPLTVNTTPGVKVAGANIYNIVAGATPKGTISAINAPVATIAAPTNMATSAGFPWTTGRITVSQPAAAGTPERWVLQGADLRTANGAGTIQLVSGALSIRPPPALGGSGPNANRGWVRLELIEVTGAPSVSNLGLGVLAFTLLGTGIFVGLRRGRHAESA